MEAGCRLDLVRL